MCTFLSQLPKKSKSNGTSQNKSLVLSLRPCPDKDGKPSWYRVRLLAWSSPEKNDRDDPFIVRYVHQVWKKNEKGFPVIDDEVTCPVTKHVHVEGNRYDACPICKLSNQYFLTCKESNWKDRDAAKKNSETSRKYQAIIPVYVKDDPNYPQNNNKFKVLIFSDKKFYQEFRSKVEKASQVNCVFNGKNAVDCCLHVSEVEEVRNPGQPNEYVYKQKVIDKVTFTTKPYDIPSITKEWVTNSGFDEEYYTSSTPDELQMFYNRHFKISNDDIPEEDIVQIYDSKPTKQINEITEHINNIENTNVSESNDISDDDLNDLAMDSDNISDDIKTEQSDSSNTDSVNNIDDFINNLDI
jgi:hypothetical protein